MHPWPRLTSLWRRLTVRHDLSVLEIAPSTAVLPKECACCGALASKTLPETRRSDRACLFIPYCTECHFHVASIGTRWFAGALASGVFGLTAALALPLVWTMGSIGYAVGVLAAALAPLAAVWGYPTPNDPGHAAAGRAVWWLRDGTLACANEAWAALLVRNEQASRAGTRKGRPAPPRWALVGAAAALVVAPFSYQLHFPVVRVLNLTDEPLHVALGSAGTIWLDPAQSESPNAGVDLRVNAGSVAVHVEDAHGRIVDHRSVTLRAGTPHVYAPGAPDRCFWLEIDEYGRHKRPGPGPWVQPLRGPGPWALGTEVDTWFGPNPVPSQDTRSSGGRLVALRQARCREAPAAVRAVRGSAAAE